MPTIPPGNDSFAMVPRSIIIGLQCDPCIRLYCALDQRQGKDGWPWRGINPLAVHLGWLPETVRKHILHLANAGIVELTPPHEKGRAMGDTRIRVVHNPARGKRVRLAITPEWTVDPPVRWRRQRSTTDPKPWSRPDSDMAPPWLPETNGQDDTMAVSRSEEVWEGCGTVSERGKRECSCGELLRANDDELCWKCTPF